MVDHVCQTGNFLQEVECTCASACLALRGFSVKWTSLSVSRTPVALAGVLVDFPVILVYVRLNSKVSFGSSWVKLVCDQIRKESSVAFQVIYRLLKQVYVPKDFNIHLKSVVIVITNTFATNILLLLYIAYRNSYNFAHFCHFNGNILWLCCILQVPKHFCLNLVGKVFKCIQLKYNMG